MLLYGILAVYQHHYDIPTPVVQGYCIMIHNILLQNLYKIMILLLRIKILFKQIIGQLTQYTSIFELRLFLCFVVVISLERRNFIIQLTAKLPSKNISWLTCLKWVGVQCKRVLRHWKINTIETSLWRRLLTIKDTYNVWEISTPLRIYGQITGRTHVRKRARIVRMCELF